MVGVKKIGKLGLSLALLAKPTHTLKRSVKLEQEACNRDQSTLKVYRHGDLEDLQVRVKTHCLVCMDPPKIHTWCGKQLLL